MGRVEQRKRERLTSEKAQGPSASSEKGCRGVEWVCKWDVGLSKVRNIEDAGKNSTTTHFTHTTTHSMP